jgi:hypothetical protein
MSSYERIKFKHVIIDAEGPIDPHIKAVGDINGDGIAEVVIPSSKGGPLVWYEYPNFPKHVIVPSGNWSCYAKVLDMDGDGDLDILISDWSANNRIEWYENPMPSGNPATDPWKHHIIGSPRAHDIDVGDIDGDGQMEFVTRWKGEEGNRIFVWKRNADDSWAKRAIDCPAGEGLTLGDIDNDGKLEVIIGGRWYKASEDILHEPWKEHIFADWPEDAVAKVADINKDGRLDVVLVKTEGPYRISWFEVPLEPDDTEWIEHIIDSSIVAAHSLAICDMDDDGNLDVVTAEQHTSPQKRVMVYFNEGNGVEWKQQVVATTGSHNLCIADLDGNGTPDIMGANWTGDYQPIEMWLNLGKACFRK